MNLEEINLKIKEVQESELNAEKVALLFNLIRWKIIKIEGEEDIRQFSSIVRYLKLSKKDEKELIEMRNYVAHSFLNNLQIKKRENWIKYNIIPAVLSYPRRNTRKIREDFEKRVVNKLIKFAKNNNFEYQNEPKIRIGNKKTTITPDFLLISDQMRIIFEVKYGDPSRTISQGIRRLMTALLAFKSKLGILIIPGSKIYDEINEKDYNILVIGNKSDFDLIKDWIFKKKPLANGDNL